MKTVLIVEDVALNRDLLVQLLEDRYRVLLADDGQAALAQAAATGPATAHPHVWISVATTVVYGNGAVTALRHRWTFDEIYTAMAIQGLDANNDGAYDRAELAELAKVNVHGLKEFGYFTTAKLGEEAVETVIAAMAQPDKLVSEAADLMFHLCVLLADAGLDLDDVRAELDRREGLSGHAEKAARTKGA